MNSKDFRAELVKIMPGYSWTVHKPLKSRLPSKLAEDLPEVLAATGIQSSGSNRLSTLEVTRREAGGAVTYEARSSGYGTRAPWLHETRACVPSPAAAWTGLARNGPMRRDDPARLLRGEGDAVLSFGQRP